MKYGKLFFMKKVWFFCFCVFSFSTTYALELTISQYPDSPREGEEIKFTLESDKYDLDIASTTWMVDGQVVDAGIGRKTLSIKAPSNGLTQIIGVTVEQEGYNHAQAQRVLEANTNFIHSTGGNCGRGFLAAASSIAPGNRGRMSRSRISSLGA